MKSSRGRGKPRTVNRDLVIEKVLVHKDEIATNNNIVPSTHAVWGTLSHELGLSHSTIHSYVVNNRYGLKDLVLKEYFNDDEAKSDSTMSSIYMDSSKEETSDVVEFSFAMKKDVFNAMITELTTVVIRKNKKIRRTRTILKPNVWTNELAFGIWNAKKMQHAFKFKNHSLTRDGKTGTLSGACNCGTSIMCKIDNGSSDIFTNIECFVQLRNNDRPCDKRPINGVLRKTIANELGNQEVHVFKANLRRELQEYGDRDPPIIANDGVYNNIRHEKKVSRYLDPDPMKALSLLKSGPIGKNVIHNIGQEPFFIFIFSNYQIRLWNMYSKKVPLIIDSTSGVCMKIQYPGKQLSRSIFLHVAVINCKYGQNAVLTAMTERQDSLTLQFFLKRSIQLGANIPMQTICDSSRALLTACITAYTPYLTVEDYCDAFFNDASKMNDVTLVSIDVAHYIKIWAQFLKDKNKRIKIFYMACIGQLILCKNIQSFQNILEQLLFCSLSETDGNFETGIGTTTCEKKKNALKALITGTEAEYENFCEELQQEQDNNVSDDEDVFQGSILMQSIKKHGKTKWEMWAINIEKKVKSIIEEEVGCRDNAHYDVAVAKKLLKECKHLPMWTCLFNNKFDNNNIKPSSSAPVESEMRKILHGVLNNQGKKMRVDRTAELIIKYYDGRLRNLSQEVDTGSSIDKLESQENVDTLSLQNDSPVEEVEDSQESINSNRSVNSRSPETEKSSQISTSTPKLVNECNCDNENKAALFCKICKKTVHKDDNCSVPHDDEAMEWRICMFCHSADQLKYKLALNEIENHKGLAVKDMKKENSNTRKNLYLGDSTDRISDALAFSSGKFSLPVLKNGSTMALKFVKIDKKSYSFVLTCGFDSLVQIMLTAINDYLIIKNNFVNLSKYNDFVKLVLDISNKGITAQSYQSRGKLLLQYYEKSSENVSKAQNDPQRIDCSTAVNDLHLFIFKDMPSFIQRITCKGKCSKKYKHYVTHIVKLNTLYNSKTFLEIIKKEQNKREYCSTCNAEVNVETLYGNIMCLEIYGLKEQELYAELNRIPKRLKDSDDNIFFLTGLVAYEGLEIQKKGDVGHYTAISYRAGNWVLYDDFRDKPITLKKNLKVKPKLIFYIKQ